ncbi:type II toxin-antitoxin system VapC family toxin [Geminocystis sp. CENA526]|uniref:type II toxin-antitoxin system VapC family toxin n=1 Tax=Geminocystis sp. CENA526 TaxID=1355871 RepID=UPI003D6DD92C
MMSINKICLDASFVIRYLSQNNSDSIYVQKLREWQEKNYTLIAPTLIMYEVTNAFHRAVIAGQITESEAKNFLEEAMALNINFYGDKDLHRDAMKLANLFRLPATYDAHYLALANRFSVELWTADSRLYNSVSASLSWVKLI